MNELEKIIERASCPCRDEECQRELAHVRRAIREALEMAAIMADMAWVNGYNPGPQIRALAATLDKGKP